MVFDEIDVAMAQRITGELSFSALGALTLVSKHYNTLFSGAYQKAKAVNCVVRSCMQALIQGNSAPYFKLINDNPHYIMRDIEFEDNVGRKFEKISIFKYLCWSLNGDLLKQMEPVFLISDELTRGLQKQWNELFYQSLSYQFQNTLVKERMYDLSRLTGSLRWFLDGEDKLDYRFWPEKIGFEQRILPINMLQRFYDIKKDETMLFLPELLQFTSWEDCELGSKRALQHTRRQVEAVRMGNKTHVQANLKFVVEELIKMALETREIISLLIKESTLEPKRQGYKI